MRAISTLINVEARFEERCNVKPLVLLATGILTLECTALGFIAAVKLVRSMRVTIPSRPELPPSLPPRPEPVLEKMIALLRVRWVVAAQQ